MPIMRHPVLAGSVALLLGACAPGAIDLPVAPPPLPAVEPPPPPSPPRPVATPQPAPAPRPAPQVDPELVALYASRRDGDFTLPAIDVTRIERRFLRERVPYETEEAPGTIIIETASRHLFLVEEDGMATRYGIAVGREGFGWTGEGRIARKARWPRWTPPAEMIERDRSLEKWRSGMPGGPSNPLGARALYIYFGDTDSLYRVHGTNEPYSIGRRASSGCFRMLNHDVIDLHARVPHNARIVVR